MANIEQMIHVANSCVGYESKVSTFESSIGAQNTKSCTSCENFKNDRCQKNLFDSTLTSLDQG